VPLIAVLFFWKNEWLPINRMVDIDSIQPRIFLLLKHCACLFQGLNLRVNKSFDKPARIFLVLCFSRRNLFIKVLYLCLYGTDFLTVSTPQSEITKSKTADATCNLISLSSYDNVRFTPSGITPGITGAL